MTDPALVAAHSCLMAALGDPNPDVLIREAMWHLAQAINDPVRDHGAPWARELNRANLREGQNQ